MGRRLSRLGGFVLCVALLVPLGPAPAAALTTAFDGRPETTERIDRTDPGRAAVEASRLRFSTDAARHVAISRDDLFADALAGAPLTAEGPMLFTPTEGLEGYVRDEIDRVLPGGGRIYLLGGPDVVGPAVADELGTAGYRVIRLAGESRIETSIAIARQIRRLYGPDRGGTVALARGWGPTPGATAAWADSVSGGAWAAAERVPIVHTMTERLHGATASFLSDAAPDTTVLFGGTAALSTAVERAVPNPRRVAGPDRTATAAAVATTLWDGNHEAGPRRFVVIDGYGDDGWSFGLAVAGIAALWDAPVLMVAATSAPTATLELVAACDTPEVDLLLAGSTSVIPTSVQAELDARDGEDCGTDPPPPACVDDVLEDNDFAPWQIGSLDVPHPDDLGFGLIQALVACPNDDDWYVAWLAPGDGQLLASVSFYPGEGDVDLLIYDEDGTPVASGSGLGDPGVEVATFTPPDVGPYALRVVHRSGGAGGVAYDIRLEPDGNPLPAMWCDEARGDTIRFNDQAADATELTTAPSAVFETVCFDDEDWYRLHLAEGERVEVAVDFTHAWGDIDLRVYAGGALVAGGASTTDNEQITFRAPHTGPFDLQIVLVENVAAGNRYRLVVTTV